MGDTENPLIGLDGLPPFSRIKAEHVVPAVKQTLKEVEARFQEIEKATEVSWETVLEPLAAINRKMHNVWGPISHLHSTMNSPELRSAYEEVQGEVVASWLKMQQSEKIYEKLEKLQKNPKFDQMSSTQRRVIEGKLLDAKLSGIGLKGKEKERFNELAKEMSELQTKFSNNVLDSTKAFQLILKEKEEIAGFPESLLSLCAHLYNQKFPDEKTATSSEGPWLVTLDFPVFGPFMENAERRDLREKLYRAYVTRASSGEFDNQQNLLRILQIRKEQAQLLDFESYAEMSLARKMADKVEDVYKLEEELRQASYEKGVEELEEIEAFAKSKGFHEEIKNWDLSFWAKHLKEERYQFSEEDVRPYFPLPKVFDGLFALVKNIFSIEVKEADGEAEVWHEDVRFFKLFDENNQHIASLFADPYSRPETKRGGAWMDDCLGRHEFTEKVQNPVAYIVCNFSPPVGDTPSLLTFREVETLFHEFGHALQHMLTKVSFSDVAGVNGIEWDAVELASQFMENWCYHKKTLQGLAKHYQTGETLPDALYEKILASKNYRAAQLMLRQINFGLVDMELHSRFDPNSGKSVFDVEHEVAEKTAVIKPIPEDRFLCAFSHIFAGGYAAGYYSYKWAEVLSADAFAAFEEVGLENHEEVSKVGLAFRDTVMALGGSVHPSEVFRKFRGRDPSTMPLLKHSGLA